MNFSKLSEYDSSFASSKGDLLEFLIIWLSRAIVLTNAKGGLSMTQLLKPRDAAKRLAVSERTLWSQTEPRGPIRAVRIGKAVRYSPEALDEFVRRQVEGEVSR